MSREVGVVVEVIQYNYETRNCLFPDVSPSIVSNFFLSLIQTSRQMKYRNYLKNSSERFDNPKIDHSFVKYQLILVIVVEVCVALVKKRSY